jgi:hypothetical protein
MKNNFVDYRNKTATAFFSLRIFCGIAEPQHLDTSTEKKNDSVPTPFV